MVVSASHFKDVTNGYEKRTDGLWVHTGHMRMVTNAARIHNAGYSDGHIQLRQATPSEPRIGFHEVGSGALALYKEQGVTNQLRVRGFDGADYPLAGAPGSVTTGMLASGAVHQPMGTYAATTAFSTVTPGVWYETPVQVTATFTGVVTRLEYSASVSNNTVGGFTYLGYGVDGSAQVSIAGFTESVANHIQTLGGTYYVTPALGSHRLALYLHAASGVASLFNGVTSRLYVTEQRR